MTFLLALIVPLLSFAQTKAPTASPPRMATWSCHLNAHSMSNSKQKLIKHPELLGTGLITCKSAAGFTTEMPVKVVIGTTRDHEAPLEEMKVTLQSESFSVGNRPEALYGTYEIDGPSPKFTEKSELEVLMRSADRSQVMPLKISVPSNAVGKWQINTMKLSLLE